MESRFRSAELPNRRTADPLIRESETPEAKVFAMKGKLPMRRSVFPPAILLMLAAPFAAAQAAAGAAPSARKAPPTRSEETSDVYGGVPVADPYRWLEEQKSPETRAWIDAQNRYSEAVLHAFPGRDALRRRLGELLKVDTVTTPTETGGR